MRGPPRSSCIPSSRSRSSRARCVVLISGETTRASGHASLPLNAYAMAPGEYLEHLLRVKARVGIPIIASLNGTTPEGWLQYHAPSNAPEPMRWN